MTTYKIIVLCAAAVATVGYFLCRWARHSWRAVPLDLAARNHLLLNHAHTHFYADDLEGNMTYISPNCSWLLGYEPDEIIGQNIAKFIHADDLPLYMEFMQQINDTGQAKGGLIYRILHKDGSIQWYLSNLAPVTDQKGRTTGYVGSSQNITELQETKDALRKANESLSRIIEQRETELRAAINQALTAAESEARKIGEHIHDELCQELIALARFAETAHLPNDSCCNRCHQTFNRFQEKALCLAGLARTYSHHLAFYELDIHSLPDAFEALSAQADRLYGASIEINMAAQLPPLDDTAVNHIYRIVRESVTNALTHGNARQIWIDAIREIDQLVISVTNNGHPLPAPDEITPGLGTQQIEMRTRLLGGSFSRTSQPDGLTVAELKTPIPTKETS